MVSIIGDLPFRFEGHPNSLKPEKLFENVKLPALIRPVSSPTMGVKLASDKNVQRNNSNKTDVPTRTTPSEIYRDCQYSGRIIRVEGDGRCLFRSLVTCRNEQLQKALRDEFGCPYRLDDSVLETNMSDDLRKQVVTLMQDNAHFYSQLGKGIINADQPSSHGQGYNRFGERLHAMTISSTMPGDLELNATSSVLEVRILVLDVNLRYIYLYGKDLFPEATVLAVRYTRLGPDVGHYDAVILDTSFDNQVAHYELQRIDHLEPELDLATQSLREPPSGKSKPDAPLKSTQDKCCQTASLIYVDKIDGCIEEKELPLQMGQQQKSKLASGKEMVCKEEITEMQKICDHCQNMFLSPPCSIKRETSQPNPKLENAIPGTVKSENQDQITKSNQCKNVKTESIKRETGDQISEPKRNGLGTPRYIKKEVKDPYTNSKQSDRFSRRSIKVESGLSANQTTYRKSPKRNFNAGKSLSRLSRTASPKYKPISSGGTRLSIDNRPNSQTDKITMDGELKGKKRHLLYKDHYRNLAHHSGTALVQKKMKLPYACKRKWQDCNENHKSHKIDISKKKKNSASTSRIKSTSPQNTRASPSHLPRVVESHGSPRRPGVQGGMGSGLVPPKSQSPRFLQPQPVPVFDYNRKCFICLDAVSLSRSKRVQCFLCGKLAHRPCVRKYLGWDLESQGQQYFLCAQCVPL